MGRDDDSSDSAERKVAVKDTWVDYLFGILAVLVFASIISFVFYMAYEDSRWTTVREETVRAILVDKQRHITSHGSQSRYFVVSYQNSENYVDVSQEFYEKYNPNDEVPICRILQVNPDGEKRRLFRETCE